MATLLQKLSAWAKKPRSFAPRRRSHSGPVVGFDSGHQVIKVVRLRGTKPPLVVEDAFLEMRGLSADAEVERKIKERGYLALPAAFSLADENVETHGFKLPKLEPEEIETAIAWELKKTIASPDFVYHDVLQYPTTSGVDVECVVASRDVVNAIFASAEKCGVNPKFLETESSAILACVRAFKSETPNRMAVIDLGYSSFRLVFFHAGRVSLTRSLYFGLGSLAGGDAGIQVTGNERGLQEGLYNLCEEFRRSEFFGKDKKGLEEIEEVVLCGGGAVLAPVRAYLEQHLSDKKLSVLDPFEGTPQLPESVGREMGPLWVVAVGLALREAA